MLEESTTNSCWWNSFLTPLSAIISITFFFVKQSAQSRFLSLRHAILFFPVAAHSGLLSLLETISEALLRETFLWGCVGVILQANSLLFYWLSKSRGPQFLALRHAIFVFSQKNLKARQLEYRLVAWPVF